MTDLKNVLNLCLLSGRCKLSSSIFIKILFATRRQRLDFGEVGHMGVELKKNIRACNPFPLPPTDRWWSRSVCGILYILAPLPCVIFFL